jgi:hypothetical protein
VKILISLQYNFNTEQIVIFIIIIISIIAVVVVVVVVVIVVVVVAVILPKIQHSVILKFLKSTRIAQHPVWFSCKFKTIW